MRKPRLVSSEWLLRSAPHKDTLRNSKKGAAIPHLNREIFHNLLVGIPPYQEQVRIANRIEILFDKLK